jgi:hypothetical protein
MQLRDSGVPQVVALGKMFRHPAFFIGPTKMHLPPAK